jgi:hypothetical protein
VQKGNNLGLTLGENVPREALEGGAPGAASIYNRGHASIHAPQVGMYTITVKTLKDMGMQVNQAWRYNLPRHLQHTGGLLTRNRWRHMRNLASLDRNILYAVEANRWVNHGTTLE